MDLWQASEPRHPDAAVLRAETEVMRMFAATRTGRQPDAERLDVAARLCQRAAELAPRDPYPWVSLFALAGLYPQGRSSMGAWGLTGHWNDERARGDLQYALDAWIAHRTPAAQDVADLNHLAHGLVKAGRADRAGEVFRLLDNRATEAPWSYTGDAEQPFIRWRNRTRTV